MKLAPCLILSITDSLMLIDKCKEITDKSDNRVMVAVFL